MEENGKKSRRLLRVLLLWCCALLALIGPAARAGDAPNDAPGYNFTTIARRMDFGDDVPPGRSPLFNPHGIAVDRAGNIYVANTRNQTIWKLTPTGQAGLLAGRKYSPGSADGRGPEARFCFPQGVAVDNDGNVFVADSGNNTIRKVTPAGNVTTLAGFARRVGSADGMGAAAEFNYPNSVAVDRAGNVFVADLYNNTIRKLTAAGTVTTLAGLAGAAGREDGKGRAARFNVPASVAVDAAGNVYVADVSNNAIRKITPQGSVTTLAGQLAYGAGSADGIGGAAQFFNPRGLAVDGAGNVYVADTANDTLRRITPAGAVTTVGGLAGRAGYADGPGGLARFWHPNSVAVDCGGALYVADLGNGAIRKAVPGDVAAAGPARLQARAGSASTPH